MDKLKDVPQESQTNLLQEDKTEYQVLKSQCNWVMTSGKLDGQLCDKGAFEKAYDGKKYCSAHLITMARKEAKENPQLEKGQEVTVTIKASEPENPYNVTMIPLDRFPPQIDVPLKKKKKVEFAPLPEPELNKEDENIEQEVRDMINISKGKISDDNNDRILKIIENLMATMANLTELLRK
jgi:hypothetical protein